MSFTHMFGSRLLIAGAFLVHLPAAVAAGDALPPEAFTSKSTGEIELSLAQNSPIYVEFEWSPTLSARLAEALAAKGFVVVTERSTAAATLVIRGDIALLGGPDFAKGVKAPIGEVAEKSVQLARKNGDVRQADVVQSTLGVAINAAGFNVAVTPFWRGLYLGNMVSVLAESSGIKGMFNRAVAGDPRGICLSRCADWNKVNQSAYVWITFQAGDTKREVRVLTKAFSESIVPEQVVDRALVDAIAAMKLADARTDPSK